MCASSSLDCSCVSCAEMKTTVRGIHMCGSQESRTSPSLSSAFQSRTEEQSRLRMSSNSKLQENQETRCLSKDFQRPSSHSFFSKQFCSSERFHVNKPGNL